MKRWLMRSQTTYKQTYKRFTWTRIILRAFFSEWLDRIFNRVENHNETGSRSVVLIIEHSDVSVTKSKRKLFLESRGMSLKYIMQI